MSVISIGIVDNDVITVKAPAASLVPPPSPKPW
ncbi:hypothetical protein Uis4E_0479 [Bifidobacterium parmae]|uniref:Uncharacterized protein n=1 Tax=Bifidobacterium parmae TaxID=361854 RepID=A0A2N5J599_9BIFI|nr:hypothetical protein Uis4E_0479 [Bifidobacterium parmae]